MKKIRVWLLLAIVINVVSQTSKPDKVGVLLRYEKGNKRDLKAYIDHFMDPGCACIEEFNIIVSHEAALDVEELQIEYSPYQTGIPVNFYIATEQEAQYRFRIPKNSKAQVYYFSSIFINEEMCQDIEEYLYLAQKRMVSGLFGMIGELQSASSIQVDLRRKEDEIFYYDKIPGNHYCLVEDIRLIPRHILELSQSQIKEVSLMASQIKPYCEDIFLNFVSAHFYPELRPLAYNFPTTTNIAVDEANEYEQKNFCIRKFVNILGYVPVYYQRKEFSGEIWVNPNLPKVIELKKQQVLMAISKPPQTQTRMLPELEVPITATTSQADAGTMVLNILHGTILALLTTIVFYLLKIQMLEHKLSSVSPRSQ